ncbi:MAG: hypothetical protein EBZ59_11065, partial [Planctomycetia bacterium]|nr:hypothetical protein [Planctomycetia bacterium]
AVSLTLTKLGSPQGYRSFSFCLAYFLLVLAFHPSLRVPWSPRIGDYSYGTYLYGWPIQQVVAPFATTPLSMFLISYPLILCAAVASWHLVEKPALSLIAPRGRSQAGHLRSPRRP